MYSIFLQLNLRHEMIANHANHKHNVCWPTTGIYQSLTQFCFHRVTSRENATVMQLHILLVQYKGNFALHLIVNSGTLSMFQIVVKKDLPFDPQYNMFFHYLCYVSIQPCLMPSNTLPRVGLLYSKTRSLLGF